MPVGRSADFILGGKPFMLVRNPTRGRSWQRSGQPDSPARRSQVDVRYGNVPDELDHPEVWDDFSGGFGDAYRDPGRPNAIHWSENMDTRFPRQMVHCQNLRKIDDTIEGISGDAGRNTHGFLDTVQAGNWIGMGNVTAMQASGFTIFPPANVNSFSGYAKNFDKVNYGARAVLFGSFYYLPVLEATQFARIDFAYAIINTDTHGMPGRLFAVGGNKLWRIHGPGTKRNLIQSCTEASPIVPANWTATVVLGNGQLDATDIITLGSQVCVGMPDGLYVSDQSGTFYNVLAELANQKNDDNARDLTIHENAVIVPHIAGLYKYHPSSQTAVAQDIGPSMRSNRSPLRGHVRAARGFGPWLFAGLWTGSQSYILAGRDASPGLPYAWYPMQRLPTPSKISRIHIDSVTTSSGGVRQLPNRQWIATEVSIEITGTSPLYFYEIPRGHGNPLNAEPTFSANYVGSARVDLPATHWQAPGTPKVWRALEAWADQLASGAIYGDFFYTIDNIGRPWLGRVQASPKTTLYFGHQQAGNAAGFASASSQFLSIASNTDLAMGDIDFTLAAWINLTTKTTDRGLVGKWAIGNAEYLLYYDATLDRVVFIVRNLGDTANAQQNAASLGAPATGTWYFVVAWHDSVNNTLNIQVNDGTVDSSAYSAGVRSGTAAFEVGRHNGTNLLDGVVDTVALWKRVLTSAERTSLYNAGNGTSFDGLTSTLRQSLIAWWDMEEPNGLRHDSFASNHLASNAGVTQVAGIVQQAFATGQAIAVSLESYTASVNTTPIWRSIVLRGALRAKSIDEVTALVRIADGQRDRQGQPMRPGLVQVQDLRDFAKSGTPQQLEDLAGATSWVNVLAPIGEEEIYQKGDDDPEIAATVKMAVLDFSSV